MLHTKAKLLKFATKDLEISINRLRRARVACHGVTDTINLNRLKYCRDLALRQAKFGREQLDILKSWPEF